MHININASATVNEKLVATVSAAAAATAAAAAGMERPPEQLESKTKHHGPNTLSHASARVRVLKLMARPYPCTFLLKACARPPRMRAYDCRRCSLCRPVAQHQHLANTSHLRGNATHTRTHEMRACLAWACVRRHRFSVCACMCARASAKVSKLW